MNQDISKRQICSDAKYDCRVRVGNTAVDDLQVWRDLDIGCHGDVMEKFTNRPVIWIEKGAQSELAAP